MLLPHGTTQRQGWIAGIFVVFCFFGIALALSWAAQPRPAKTLRRFNGLWKERVAVEVFGGLWLVRPASSSARRGLLPCSLPLDVSRAHTRAQHLAAYVCLWNALFLEPDGLPYVRMLGSCHT